MSMIIRRLSDGRTWKESELGELLRENDPEFNGGHLQYLRNIERGPGEWSVSYFREGLTVYSMALPSSQYLIYDDSTIPVEKVRECLALFDSAIKIAPLIGTSKDVLECLTQTRGWVDSITSTYIKPTTNAPQEETT